MQSTVPSDLYPILAFFLKQQHLKETLKAFEQEASTKAPKSSEHDLVAIYNFYLSHHVSKEQ